MCWMPVLIHTVFYLFSAFTVWEGVSQESVTFREGKNQFRWGQFRHSYHLSNMVDLRLRSLRIMFVQFWSLLDFFENCSMYLTYLAKINSQGAIYHERLENGKNGHW